MTNFAENGGRSNPSVTTKGPLVVDRAQIERFAAAVFRHAGSDVFVSLRAFPENKAGGGGGKPIWVEAVQVNSSADALCGIFEMACEIAQFTATHAKPAVFCPPLAGFSVDDKADEASIVEGYLISVECDKQPGLAREKLEALLGPATIVVRSGGTWSDPETGEVQGKLHLHWRLTKAARGDDHRLLKEARRMATELVGADPSNIPVSHPIRWPGSWHRKGDPRLSKIAAICENEVDLKEARDTLMNACARRGDVAPALAHRRTARASGAGAVKVEKLISQIIGPGGDRSAHFQACVNAAAREGIEVDQIEEVMLRHPEGCASKYIEGGRLRAEIERSLGKAQYTARPQAYSAAPELVDFTQDGVARVFAEKHADGFGFCHSAGSWFVWDGVRWRRDDKEIVFQAVRSFCRLLSEGGRPHEVHAGRKTSFIVGVEKLVRGDPAFAHTADNWDRDPFLLGTPAGTVDLKTGDLREGRPCEGITKSTTVAPSDAADCPLWRQFIEDVTQGDCDFGRFLQQWFGYSLTGDTREQKLLFTYGPGGNGKSVCLNTVSSIIGEYATVAPADTFAISYGSRHPTELAKLRGARMVTCSETEKGKPWAEDRIKSITGGDTISARYMRGNFFDFKPELKLTIVGNHKPVLHHVDEAIRRRILIAPFLHAPRSKDPKLEDKLRVERPAILRWMIDGCQDWQHNGLLVPEVVRASTADYFETQDTFAHWLEERCELSRDGIAVDCLFSELYADWATYAKFAGELPGSQKVFSEMLVGKGFRREKVGRKKLTTFYGLRLSVSQSHVSLNEGIFA